MASFSEDAAIEAPPESSQNASFPDSFEQESGLGESLDNQESENATFFLMKRKTAAERLKEVVAEIEADDQVCEAQFYFCPVCKIEQLVPEILPDGEVQVNKVFRFVMDFLSCLFKINNQEMQLEFLCLPVWGLPLHPQCTSES